MSLISCPDCKRDVSDIAEKCPNCGRPILDMINSLKPEKVSCSECSKEYQFPENFCPSCGCINGKKKIFYEQFQSEQAEAIRPSVEARPNSEARSDFNPGVAALLSLIIPGAGQIYKGSLVVGLAWLMFTIVGYFIFVLPGLVIHLLSIFNAYNSPRS